VLGGEWSGVWRANWRHPHSSALDRSFTTVYTTLMGRADATGYDGVPYENLVIAAVTWSKSVSEHMATRSERYGRAQFDVSDPEWATEAARDPDRLVGDRRSRDGDTVRVIGWSSSAPARGRLAGRVLKVWLEGDGPTSSGRWTGRSACEANDGEQQKYWAAVAEEES